jgi:Fur family transcriptional regulator, peroxide stress response regulator
MINDTDQRYKSLIHTLHERGSRMTSHRMALARLLAVSEGHPNATQLYEELQKQFPTISLATVYKTLALLKENGEVLEIDLHEDSRYDGNKPYPHPHMVCTECNRIFDGDDALVFQKLNKEIEEKYNFQVSRFQILFYGICEDCR